MSEFNSYADQLNIETPEQVDLHFPVAGVGSRFIAVLLDSLLQGVFFFVLFLILAAVAASLPAGSVPQQQHLDRIGNWFIAIFVMVQFLMYWGYYSLFEAFWRGQTPGKRVMKLRVLKDSGRSITLFESLARNLIRVIDFLPSAYLVGLITMLCNRQNKRLGDYVAGTIVVHERVQEQPLMSHISRTFTSPMYEEPTAATRLTPRAQEAWAANEAGLPADAAARLQASDLNVIETFFSRALDLSIEKREQLGARVAAQMCAKMQFAPPADMPPERLLELIAHRMRSQAH